VVVTFPVLLFFESGNDKHTLHLEVEEIFTEQPEREAGHSPLHNAKIDNSWRVFAYGLLYIRGTLLYTVGHDAFASLSAFYRCPLHMLVHDTLICECGLLVLDGDAFVVTCLRHLQKLDFC
jgi:hypothetical protein